MVTLSVNLDPESEADIAYVRRLLEAIAPTPVVEFWTAKRDLTLVKSFAQKKPWGFIASRCETTVDEAKERLAVLLPIRTEEERRALQRRLEGEIEYLRVHG